MNKEKEIEKLSTKKLVTAFWLFDGGEIYASKANWIKTGLAAEKIENKIDEKIVK